MWFHKRVFQIICNLVTKKSKTHVILVAAHSKGRSRKSSNVVVTKEQKKTSLAQHLLGIFITFCVLSIVIFIFCLIGSSNLCNGHGNLDHTANIYYTTVRENVSLQSANIITDRGRMVNQSNYRKVASTSPSHLEAQVAFFR